MEDNILRKNPFDFELATVLVNDSVTREAITRKEERTFLEFIKMISIIPSTTMLCIFCLRQGCVFLNLLV